MLKTSLVSALSALALLALGVSIAATAHGELALGTSHRALGLKWGPCPEFMPEGCGITVLHGSPAAPNADVFVRLPAGSKVAAHTHTSAERMVLLSGRLEVKYEGQPSIVMRAGKYGYSPPNKPHEALCYDGEDCVLFIAFESPVDASEYYGEVN